MNLEGQIEIDITVHTMNGKKDVSIINNRPVQAAQLLVGKSVDEVLSLIPMLFHVCGKAQGAAAVRAITAAKGLPVDESLSRARAALVDIEFLREHLLRIFLDWPKHFPDGAGLVSQKALQSLMQSGPRFESALFGTTKPFSLFPNFHPNWTEVEALLEDFDQLLTATVFGSASDDWLAANTGDGALDWCRTGESVAARACRQIIDNGWAGEGVTDVPFLPELSAEDVYHLLFDADASAFVAAPTWQGRAHETSCFSRCFNHPLLESVLAFSGPGLLARYMARLVEIAVVFARLRDGVKDLKTMAGGDSHLTPSFAKDIGIGLVEASRGLLAHGVQLDGDKIAQYRILAPTEWNFNDMGPLVCALQNIKGTGLAQIKQIADVIVPAIDPCTQTKLEARYA